MPLVFTSFLRIFLTTNTHTLAHARRVPKMYIENQTVTRTRQMSRQVPKIGNVMSHAHTHARRHTHTYARICIRARAHTQMCTALPHLRLLLRLLFLFPPPSLVHHPIKFLIAVLIPPRETMCYLHLELFSFSLYIRLIK